MRGGDARHQRLGAVAARDAEQVGAVRDRLPGDRGHVDRAGAAHQEHLRAERLRLVLQVELAHLPAAGSRVHDQERAPGRGRRELGHPPVRLVHGQRRAGGDAGQQPGRRGNGRDPQQAGERVDHQHRDRRRDEHRERQPAQHAPPGQHEEGGREADRRGGRAHREHGEAPPFREGHDHRDREERQHEAQPGQPPLTGAGRSGWVRGPVGHINMVTRRRRPHVTRPG